MTMIRYGLEGKKPSQPSNHVNLAVKVKPKASKIASRSKIPLGVLYKKKLAHCYIICPIINNKTEVESVQLGKTSDFDFGPFSLRDRVKCGVKSREIGIN